ncbi:MAG: glycoside hydrolase, partial [Desulfovibrio sp.]|nr:glycoside hydrolase [Desulfovibrio sp.]
MIASLCIHGHFYQPPREDPWLGEILSEASAAPLGDWNERILRESYAPLAWARRLDASGRICEILNAYEWISFNVGPTLLSWMRRHAPGVVERMRDGDAKSLARWGHGNALAQIFHHVIMPLATPEDQELETRWAIDDFRALFGRDPEGIWLSEAATDVRTLETLAAQGLRFVILAPRQARAVVVNGVATPVTEETLFIGEPYRLALPSGASLSAVFYSGSLSRSVAFEGLLRDGEQFWQRLTAAAATLAADHQDPHLSHAT